MTTKAAQANISSAIGATKCVVFVHDRKEGWIEKTRPVNYYPGETAADAEAFAADVLRSFTAHHAAEQTRPLAVDHLALGCVKGWCLGEPGTPATSDDPTQPGYGCGPTDDRRVGGTYHWNGGVNVAKLERRVAADAAPVDVAPKTRKSRKAQPAAVQPINYATSQPGDHAPELCAAARANDDADGFHAGWGECRDDIAALRILSTTSQRCETADRPAVVEPEPTPEPVKRCDYWHHGPIGFAPRRCLLTLTHNGEHNYPPIPEPVQVLEAMRIEPEPIQEAPALRSVEPVTSGRPTCPRCGQSFRRSGVGLEWHLSNRPDCAGARLRVA